MERIFRMTPPPTTSGANPVTINGRQYSSEVGSDVDMPERDALIARDNKWTLLGIVGTSSQRPKPSDDDAIELLSRNTHYIDTTLGRMIVFDVVNQVWRDPLTADAV